MTHGTERGTTADGTTDDRDEPGTGPAPDGARSTAEAPGVPAPRVPAGSAQESPEAGGDAHPDTAAGDGAAGSPPDDAAEGGSGAPATSGAGTAAGAVTRPAATERPRPLGPGPARAAWPSWEDVAVTAPPAEPPAAPAPAGSAESATPGDAPAGDAGATPDGDGAAADAPAAPRAQAAAQPALSFGGLSALAMTALNAAAVGVPAHALPRSEIDPAGTSGPAGTADPDEQGNRAPAAPAGADRSDAPAARASERDAASSGVPTDEAATGVAATPAPGATTDDGDATAADAATAGTAPADPAAADAGTRPDDDAGTTAPRATTSVAPAAPAPDAPAADAGGDASRQASAASPGTPTAPASAADAEEAEAPSDTAAVPVVLAPADDPEREAATPAGAPAADDAAHPRPADGDATPTPPRADGDATPTPPRADGDATQVLTPVSAAPGRPTDPGATQVVPPVAAAAGATAAGTRAWPTTDAGAGEARRAPGGPVPATPEAGRDPSPLDVFEPEDGRRRWPRVLAVVGGVVVLLGGAYAGASYALADRVPRGATVAGVEIGGMTADEAREALTTGLADRTSEPVPVVAQDAQAQIDPATAGLTFDADATVARLTGVDLTEPVRLWRQVVGVDAQPPVTQVDDDALETALASLSESVRLAPVDGSVVFADGAAHATDAADGWELDLAAATGTVHDEWLVGERPLTLPTTPVEPDITQEETQQALTQVAQPLASAPITVQVADRQAVLDVPTLTASASMVPVGGALELQLDGEALTAAVLAQVPDVVTVASDARFEFQNGAPVIVGGTPGTSLDPAAVAASVAASVTAEGRVAPVDLVASDPAQTTAALEALGVKEVVSEFSTPLTSEPRRTQNIAAGLQNITGTLVRPGETFSLTEALGPVDAAHGFVQAGAIVNGEHRDAWGGGLSQVSTTVFNAAYFAGFEDVEHTPHSEWFQRYPEGREATIFTGVLDMKWKNNTPYGALVQGWVADGRAHVAIWGTKHFTVETEKSGRSGIVAPTTVYSQSPTCEPQSAGNPGFSVTNTRRVFLNGELVDTESDSWRYKPQNRIVCGAAPAAPTP